MKLFDAPTIAAGIVIALCAFTCITPLQAQSAGQVMFTAYNADGNDGFAFVTLVDLANGTTIYFNDNEWNGSAIGSGGAFNTGEGTMTWSNNTGGTIIAGTVITINNANTASPSASVGSITGQIDLGTSNEVLYMYLGSNATTPTAFLSAIANDGFGTNGSINNTGLTAGTNATSITGDEDVMIYSGAINLTSISAFTTALATASNWTTQDTGANDATNGYPDFPANVPCNFYGDAFGVITYYSRNATSGGAWDSNTSWTTNADGSGGPLATGVWPRRQDNVVILSGHTITINATDDNKTCGISPDDLGQSNVGSFTSSNIDMFYQTGDITINGTLTVTGVEIMIGGYTHATATGTLSLSSTFVNVGYLELDASASLNSLDDMVLTGYSTTIINTNTTTTDDVIIDHTDATLCGTGVTTLQNGSGSQITYTNSGSISQICTTYTIQCTGTGCSGFPVTGTFDAANGYTGPGGVGSTNGTSELEFWLDGRDVNGNGTNPTTGGAVTQWRDKSGNGVHVSQSTTGVATYSAPGVTFSNTGYLAGSDATFPSGNTSRTLFTSVSSPASGADDVIFFYGAANNSQSFGLLRRGTSGNARTFFYNNDLDDSGGFLPVGTVKVIGARYSNASNAQELYVNSSLSASRTAGNPNTTTGSQGVQVGGWNSFSLFSQATINEVILYSKSVSLAERIIVDNYLAAKYGTTLSANDFYTMDNSGNGNFDYDVAGIGQASDGSRKKEARGTGVVRMSLQSTASVSDGEFLLWGHDGATLTSNFSDIDGATIKERLNRVWRVSETSDVGNVVLSFDISSLGTSPVAANLRLMIDRDGDGFADNDVTPISGATLVSNIVTFNGVNLQDGDRFTLGNTNLAAPLPVELVSFQATQSDGIVWLTWKTASEINNDYFTVLRSTDLKAWTDVQTIKGAGTTHTSTTYTTSDDAAPNGVNYYRLKQTDLDGTFTYSKAVSVLVQRGADFTVSAYPNPTHTGFTVETSQPVRASDIQLSDLAGRPVAVTSTPAKNGWYLTPAGAPSGIYILRVQLGAIQKVMRIAIQ